MARAAKPALTGTGRLKALSTAKLDELIEEAIVDAYDESEQTSGFYSMFEEHLAIPFAIGMLGVEATVERVDLTDDERIVAVCVRGKSRQRISILDLTCHALMYCPQGGSGSRHTGDRRAGDRSWPLRRSAETSSTPQSARWATSTCSSCRTQDTNSVRYNRG
jgi:hypothetical protein